LMRARAKSPQHVQQTGVRFCFFVSFTQLTKRVHNEALTKRVHTELEARRAKACLSTN
jgi:hypothetical protein